MARRDPHSTMLGTALATCLVAATLGHRMLHRRRRAGAPAGDRVDRRLAGGAPSTSGADANVVERVLDAVDRFQRRHTSTAFVFGVVKKFSEDRAGQLAALVAYYSFFSLFPLLLVLVTVLRFVLAGNEQLQQQILDSALAQIPVLGDELERGVDPMDGSTTTLVVGSLGALWAGLRAMAAAQHALDEVWDVPVFERPNFFFSRLRGLGLMGLIAGGVLGSIVVSNVATLVDGIPGGGRLALYAGSMALNVTVVGSAYLVLTDLPLRVRHVWPGALVGGASYWLLQLAGSAIVRRTVDGAQGAEGTFAVVLGLLTWLFLIGQVTLVAAELNVVWCRHLWPRSLAGRDLTEPDLRAFASYARQAKRSDVVTVGVTGAVRRGGDLPPLDPTARREPAPTG